MKKVLKAVKAVGLKTAKSSVNSASFFYMHQVKEPVSVKERLKKKKNTKEKPDKAAHAGRQVCMGGFCYKYTK